ncbi:KEOPS complex subunit Cgi121 [Natronobiforma cellulositropha]|uniref:KEOPS complex subunit Cgi121 n=1 Tax=Natronobiforma cellulositropha TaxID=1679076 RepID=UPI0021D5C407|nr:KEOPS complex subunit Cgi121 [Natronobiforma cellulositropha]
MDLLHCTLEIDDLDAFIETLAAVGEAYDTTVQAFDARYVAGPAHLERAVALADRALARGENVARERAVEILLYAAGRRQIDRALEMGVSEGRTPAAILLSGGDEAGARDALETALSLESDAPFAHTDETRLCSFFEITAAERTATDATLEELVCERVALLEVEK